VTFTLSIVHLVHGEEAVLHLLDRRLRGGDLVVDGVVQIVADQVLHIAVERGREQQGLRRVVELAEHPLDLGQEPHVGHPIGFVDDEEVDVGQLQRATVENVDQPARGRNRDVDAGAQCTDLALHRRPAVQHADGAIARRRERGEGIAHLQRQLAGRHQHEPPRATGRGLCRSLDHRQPESEGLARAGLGLAADVAPGQPVGDRQRLDRKGIGDARRGEGIDHVGRQPERGEGGLHQWWSPDRLVGVGRPPGRLDESAMR
jgi:hypothetical protein